jgi:hypothetical protein
MSIRMALREKDSGGECKNCLWNEQIKAEICAQFGNSLFTGIETGLFLNFEIDEFIVPDRFLLHAQTEASFRHEKEVYFSLKIW